MSHKKMRIYNTLFVLLLLLIIQNLAGLSQIKDEDKKEINDIPYMSTFSSVEYSNVIFRQQFTLDSDVEGAEYDFDQDGIKEFVIFHGNDVFLYEWNGTGFSQFDTFNVPGFQMHSMDIGDINGDNYAEIVLGNWYGTNNAYESLDHAYLHISTIYPNKSRSLLWYNQVSSGTSGEIQLRVGDFDGDNDYEIGYNTQVDSTGSYGILNWTGSTLVDIMHGTTSWHYCDSVGVGDLDGDGRDEFCFGYGYAGSKDGDNDIYDYNPSTQSITKRWTMNTGRDPRYPFHLVDLDGDGIDELATHAGTAYNYYAKVLNINGDTISQQGSDFSATGDNGKNFAAGRFDSSGQNKLWTRESTTVYKLYAFNGANYVTDGTVFDFSGYSDIWFLNSFDLDQNGQNELAFVGLVSGQIGYFEIRGPLEIGENIPQSPTYSNYMVGYWQFENNYDDSITSQALTPGGSGATFESGKVGARAISYDGNGYIAGNFDWNNSHIDRSFSMWFKMNPDCNGRLFCAGLNGYNSIFSVSVSNSSLFFNGYFNDKTVSVNLDYNRWYFFVLTYTASSRYIRILIDNQEMLNYTASSNLVIPSPNDKLSIGSNYGYQLLFEQRFNGYIDDFRAFENYVLSSSDLNEIRGQSEIDSPFQFSTLLWQDDFENYSLGQIGSPYSIIYSGTGAANQKITNDIAFDGNKSFHVAGQNSWSAVIERQTTFSKRFIAINAKMLADSYTGEIGGGDCVTTIGLWNKDAADWGLHYIVFGFSNNGSLWMDARGIGREFYGTYEVDTWYDFLIIVDVQMNSASLYFNRELVYNKTLGEDVSGANAVTFNGGWFSQSGYFDNVIVSETDNSSELLVINEETENNPSENLFDEKWAFNAGGTINNARIMGYYDLNGNNKEDILVNARIDEIDYVLAISDLGTLLWSKTSASTNIDVHAKNIHTSDYYLKEDYNNDGIADVLFSYNNSTIGLADGRTGEEFWRMRPFSDVDCRGMYFINDIDFDGKKDYVVMGVGKLGIVKSSDLTLLWSKSWGSTNAWVGIQPMGDLNYDGYTDLALHGCWTSYVEAVSGINGNSLWTHSVGYDAWGIAVVPDINLDGKKDLLVSPQSSQFELISGSTGNNIWGSGLSRNHDINFYYNPINITQRYTFITTESNILKTYNLTNGNYIGETTNVKWLAAGFINLGDVIGQYVTDNDGNIRIYNVGDYSNPIYILNSNWKNGMVYGIQNESQHFIGVNTTHVVFFENQNNPLVPPPPPIAPILNPISGPSMNGNVLLTWNTVVNATIYRIYRQNSAITNIEGLTSIGYSQGTSYTDIGLTNGLYYYVIVASNAGGDSSISNCQNVSVSVQPPDAPVLNMITPNPSSVGNIELTWNPAARANTYKIYRANTIITTINGLNPIASSITSTSYNDSGLVNGTYYYVIVAVNSAGDSAISNCENVNIAISDPFLNAIDNPSLSISLGGNANWFPQTVITYDGVDAVQSGDISHGQSSWFSTTVNGPGLVEFYWKVSSESNYDFLEFYVDSTRIQRISGSINWVLVQYNITTIGTYTLKWNYMKDGSVDSGSDCGWVDVIRWSRQADSLNAPVLTLVTPNISENGSSRIQWNSVQNAISYNIYREISEIQSISGLTPYVNTGNTFFQDTFSGNQYYYYAVTSVNNSMESMPSNSKSVLYLADYRYVPFSFAESNWTFRSGNGRLVSNSSNSVVLSTDGNNCDWWDGYTEFSPIYYMPVYNQSFFKYGVKLTLPSPIYTETTFGMALFQDMNNAYEYGPYKSGSELIHLERIYYDVGSSVTQLPQVFTGKTEIYLIIQRFQNNIEFLFSWDNITFTKVSSVTPTFELSNIGIYMKNWGAYANFFVNFTNFMSLTPKPAITHIPPAPIITNHTQNSTNGNVGLNWTLIPNVSSYRIYRNQTLINSTSGQTLIGTSMNGSFIDSGLTKGNYYYVVTAVNASGESNISNCVYVNVTYEKPRDPIPLTITIKTPANNTIYPSAFGISLIFELKGDGSCQTYWYQLNNRDWIQIQGNTTINLFEPGLQTIQVKGLSNSGQNITSYKNKFTLNMQSNSKMKIEIIGSTSVSKFVAGSTIPIQITIRNTGEVKINFVQIYFQQYGPNHQILSNHIKILNASLNPGQEQTYQITIMVNRTMEKIDLSGDLIADQLYVALNLEIVANDNKETVVTIIGTVGGTGAVVGVTVFSVTRLKKMKPKMNGNNSPDFEFSIPEPSMDDDIQFVL